MANCDQKKINIFSCEHFTYINQIFGDIGVRSIIQEPEFLQGVDTHNWRLVAEPGTESFVGTYHHVLNREAGNGIEKWCSVDERMQKPKANPNDTLCQSYSLLKYLEYNPKKNWKSETLQKKMVNMYRDILKNPYFKEQLREIVNIMNTKKDNLSTKALKRNQPDIWKEFTFSSKSNSCISKKGKIPQYLYYTNFEELYAKIHSVLDTWEQYGYWYYIGDGRCHPSTTPSPTIITPNAMKVDSVQVKKNTVSKYKANTI